MTFWMNIAIILNLISILSLFGLLYIYYKNLKNIKSRFTIGLFIFASLFETQGLVLAEAMAHGTPVIAFDGHAVHDIIKSGYNGFVVKDKEGMAAIIQRIHNDQELYDALVAGAWHTAQEYYPERTAKKLLNLYKRLVEQKKA